jgi:hypothetical protein
MAEREPEARVWQAGGIQRARRRLASEGAQKVRILRGARRGGSGVNGKLSTGGAPVPSLQLRIRSLRPHVLPRHQLHVSQIDLPILRTSASLKKLR